MNTEKVCMMSDVYKLLLNYLITNAISKGNETNYLAE